MIIIGNLNLISVQFWTDYLPRGGGGGLLDISLGGEVRPGSSYPDPEISLIFLPCLRHKKLCGFVVVLSMEI